MDDPRGSNSGQSCPSSLFWLPQVIHGVEKDILEFVLSCHRNFYTGLLYSNFQMKCVYNGICRALCVCLFRVLNMCPKTSCPKIGLQLYFFWCCRLNFSKACSFLLGH